MEDLHLGRIAALVPEFAVKNLSLGRTLMMMIRIKRNVNSMSIMKLFENISPEIII